MKNPLVSVVIPTYKREKEIVSRAVKSVLNQTYSKLELIVVDDSPNDYRGRKDVEELLEGLNDKRIRYIKHPENKGANISRNTGISNANGDYIAFLDDDDEWLPQKIQKQLEKFVDSRIGLVYCPYYVLNKGEKHLRRKIKSGNVFIDLLNENFIGSTSCIMVKKKYILEIGLFDENLPASQDYDLYLRLSKKYLIDAVDEPLLLYYEHDGERISGDPYKKLKARKYIYKKYKEEIKRYPRIESNKNLLLAQSYSEIKKNKLKWIHLFNAIYIYPLPTKRLLKTTLKIMLNK